MERKTNTCAIVGFILSFFCGLAGLIVSIVALSQIKKTGEKGKGLAIAGIVITCVTIILPVLYILFCMIFVMPGIDDSLVASQICNNRPGYTIGVPTDEGYVSCRKVQSDGTYTCVYNEKQNDGTLRATSITCSTSAS